MIDSSGTEVSKGEAIISVRVLTSANKSPEMSPSGIVCHNLPVRMLLGTLRGQMGLL